MSNVANTQDWPRKCKDSQNALAEPWIGATDALVLLKIMGDVPATECVVIVVM